MKKRLKLGIVGCGAIGGEVAAFLDKTLYKKISVSGLYDKNLNSACSLKKKLKNYNPKIVNSLQSLVKQSDLVLEAASWKVVKPLLAEASKFKKDLIILSIGGVVKAESLVKKACDKGITIYLPSGAICGIDGILASSQNKIIKCILTTSKPPGGFKNVKYLQEKKINIDNIKKERIIFEGSPQEAFRHFPKNINVASNLLLASRFKNTKVRIKLNPKIQRNTHEIYLESKIGTIKIKVENIPSINNPKTSALAIASTKALIKKLCSSVKIGT